MFKRLSVLFLCVLLLSCTACSSVNIQKNSKKVVIATTYSAYDWAKEIIGDTEEIEVKYLVDSAVDLHSYQPSATDIIAYKEADLVIAIGGESEEWLERLELSEDKVINLIDCVDAREEEIIEGMQAEEDEEEAKEEGPEYDEHIWLSVKNAKRCVAKISDEFGILDPDNKETYKKNSSDYIALLDNLDAEYEEAVNNSANKVLLFGDRFPFRYMVEDYGLTYYAAFIGCSAESEASFETIIFLSGKIDELGLKHVCVISDNHDIANTIIDNTKDKNMDIIEFNSLQSISNKEANNISYIDVMTTNLEALKKALGD